MFSRFRKQKVWRDQRLEGVELHLDGAVIERCTLVGCRFVYSGGPLPTLNDNTILDPRFELRDGASRTAQLLQFLRENGAGRELTAETALTTRH